MEGDTGNIESTAEGEKVAETRQLTPEEILAHEQQVAAERIEKMIEEFNGFSEILMPKVDEVFARLAAKRNASNLRGTRREVWMRTYTSSFGLLLAQSTPETKGATVINAAASFADSAVREFNKRFTESEDFVDPKATQPAPEKVVTGTVVS